MSDVALPEAQFCARDEDFSFDVPVTEWKELLSRTQEQLTELGVKYNDAVEQVARDSLFLSRENAILDSIVATHRAERDILRERLARLEQSLKQHQGEALEDLSLNELLSLKARLLHAAGLADDALARLQTQDRKCSVCFDREAETVLMPCRHCCLCADCADHATLDRCPLCREPVASRLRIFYG
jgi:uncharacterized coiled-coil protein SlyX